MWQFVAGGAEDAETPLAAAIREAAEEAVIPCDCHWIALDARAAVPWTGSLALSREHTEVRWLLFLPRRANC